MDISPWNWRKAEKQPRIVLVTWVFMATSVSMYTPRSRTEVTGSIEELLMQTGPDGMTF